MSAKPETLHATAVLIGEGALLIRGPSGCGKSALALDLIRQAQGSAHICVRLVADDRVHVEAVCGWLIASAPAKLAGLIELRYHGLLQETYEPCAVIRAVLDLDAAAPRLPELQESVCEILEVKLPRLSQPPGYRLSLHHARQLTQNVLPAKALG